MGQSTVDVLVVGAGPTGLALAAQLVAHGVRPRLIDRGTDRVHESRALAIQPRTLEVLAGLGVSENLVEHGNRMVRMRIHAGKRDLSIPLFDLGMADTAYPFLLFLSQAETERILAEHLVDHGVLIERGVELTQLQHDGDVVTAVLRNGSAKETVTARYVVGCDGAHSTVRSAAGIAFEGGSYPQNFVLVDTEADGIATDAAHVFLSERGMLFFFPLGAPASWRLLAMRPAGDDTDRAPDDITLDEVETLAGRYTEGAVRLHDPIWMTNFRLHHRVAANYRSGRIFLAGDAAHIHSPAGAQGMNTGIQDAVNLAWKLSETIHGRANTNLLDTYEAERAPVGRAVLRFTDRAFTIATTDNAFVRFARRVIAPTVIPLATRSQGGRRYAFRTIAQLAIRYRSSPLSVNGQHASRRGLRAGDRLPDAPIRVHGQPSTLHALIAEPGWHLLQCGPAYHQLVGHRRTGLTVHHLSESDPDVEVVLNPVAMRRLNLRPHEDAVYLVRPDGHIGYRSRQQQADDLAEYLDRWLPAAASASQSEP
ncbi:MAG TPA: FAD-dependent monooxygenase [Micromonosporaceae bacterium]|nr:FAD-dependent monooxygenase [Micromonosporaceae bacterium]